MADTGSSLTARLAAFLANISYEDLPADVVSATKSVLLDTLGTTLAASTLGEGSAELLGAAQSAGGVPESTLIGFGDRVPAVMAALVNGGMAHSLNFDAGGPGHLGMFVPAPLAVAEHHGAVDGRSLLAALAAGMETIARVSNAARAAAQPPGILLEGQLVGYFGAAAAAGRVMGLTPPEMHSALGLAMMQASGTMQVVFGGDAPAKAIYGAFANHGGTLAALLSRLGIRAQIAALEGQAGLFAMYYQGKYDPAVLTKGLGTEFQLLGVRYKRWPTSGRVASFIDAALALVWSEGLRGSDVETVHINASPVVRAWLEPEQERKAPAHPTSAANSIFYGVAKALANGAVTLADFTAAGLQQAEALRLAQRMSCSIEPRFASDSSLEVTTTSGKRLTARAVAKPMTYADIVEKFRGCAKHAACGLQDSAIDEVISLIERLESVPDVGVIPTAASRPNSRRSPKVNNQPVAVVNHWE